MSAPSWGRRRLVRMAAALVLIATMAAIGRALVYPPTSRTAVPKIEPFEGWTIKDVRHTRYDGDEKVVSLAIGEASARRVRLGVFRLGFANRLVARDVRAEVLLGHDEDGYDDGTDVLWSALSALAPKSLDTNAIAAVRVDGLVIRLRNREGAWVEISADRGETSALAHGRVLFRGNVCLKSDEADLPTLTSLTYDVRANRFVGDAPRPQHDTADQPIPATAIDAANRALARLMPARARFEGVQDGT